MKNGDEQPGAAMNAVYFQVYLLTWQIGIFKLIVKGYVAIFSAFSTKIIVVFMYQCIVEYSFTIFFLQMRGRENSRDDLYDSTLYSMGIPTVSLDSYIPKQRLVHFDLKGAPPKISYMKKVITLSKQFGATGLLLEYEDMFPFWGELKRKILIGLRETNM